MLNEPKQEWFKRDETDEIWWLYTPDRLGEMVFSFDKVKKFYLFRDYSCNLTQEQKEIFDKENPYWADYLNPKED